MKFCKCGCGQLINKKQNNYIHGHYWKNKKRGVMGDDQKNKIKISVIKAYENEETKNKQKENTPKGETHYCFEKEGNWKGRKHTKETKQKQRESQLGEKHHFKGKTHTNTQKEKISKSCKKWWNSKEGLKQRKTQSKKMKNGQSSYCNQFIKNPSKPQIELYKLCQEILPYPILNYPCLNFSIDIAIPQLNLAIEYDGSYWHQIKEYDNIRQGNLEKEGWIFLRYIDIIPTKEELINDIKEII